MNHVADTQLPTASTLSVEVHNLSKSYKVYEKPNDLLAEIVFRKPRHRVHHAVRNVSFAMRRGEVVGIIGSNGAGKSTLLKMIAGTLSPTSGELKVAGRISAILELGTGFHPDYSGRDNVVLGGMCLGMTREEVALKFDWIINFAELGDAIDQPFKTYSSGMAARLTFATAIAIEPEILIIDEALAAGDSYFVVKCGQRIRELCECGATVLFVSHSTYQVATLCQRAIWIDGGRVREIGEAVEVCRHYDLSVHERLSKGEGAITSVPTKPDLLTIDTRIGGGTSQSGVVIPDGETTEITGLGIAHDDVFRRGPVRITAIRWMGADGQPADQVSTWDPLKLEVEYVCPDRSKLEGTLGLSCAINRRSDMASVAMFSTVNPVRDVDLSTYDQQPYRKPAAAYGRIVCSFPHIELLEGEYLLSIGVQANVPSTADFYEYHHLRFIFRVVRNGYPSGSVFHPRVEWSHQALA
jgi:lipopolysaccharide transport system ATP-binding protein